MKLTKTISFLLLLSIVLSLASVTSYAAIYRKGRNDVSESYKSGKYYDRLTSVPITGDGPTDAVAIALSQVGYQEGNEEGEFSGLVAGSNNFTEYNYNMGNYGQGYGGIYHWCASFVAFSLYQAHCHDQGSMGDWCRYNVGDIKYVWREVSCEQWKEQLKRFEMFSSSEAFGGSYLPTYGDLIYFTSDGNTSSHIGIVLYNDGYEVYTVEGNTSSQSGLEANGGGVYVKSYPLNSSKIIGYGTLPYERNENVIPVDYSGANPTEGLYISLNGKQVYLDKDCKTKSFTLDMYEMFKVTAVDGDTLTCEFDIDGEKVIGYTKNNSYRVMQLSDARNKDLFDVTDADKNEFYIGSKHESYSVDGKEVSGKIELDHNKLISAKGYAGFSDEIYAFGYCFDNKYNKAVFSGDFSVDATDEIKEEDTAGEKALSYDISVDVSELSGEHTLTLLVKLKNEHVLVLDTVDIKVINNDLPPEDSTGGEDESSEEVSSEEVTETTANTESESESEIVSETDNTDTVSEDETEISETGSQSGSEAKKKGCKSSISYIPLAVILIFSFAFVLKKKEN